MSQTSQFETAYQCQICDDHPEFNKVKELLDHLEGVHKIPRDKQYTRSLKFHARGTGFSMYQYIYLDEHGVPIVAQQSTWKKLNQKEQAELAEKQKAEWAQQATGDEI